MDGESRIYSPAAGKQAGAGNIQIVQLVAATVGIGYRLLWTGPHDRAA